MQNLIKHTINKILGFAGVRLIRADQPAAIAEADYGLKRIMDQLAISVVFDVGANLGQYAAKLRSIGFCGRIISFEPQPAAFATLSQRTALDPQWIAVGLALGDMQAERNLNISQNSVSSSFLSASSDIVAVEPGISPIRIEKVSMKTLDHVWSSYVNSKDKIYLKIDAQGYEPEILNGAREFLSHCRAVQMEMAIFPSYRGQKLFSEMIERMDEIGFRLVHLDRGFWDSFTGYLIEVDGIFVRKEDLALSLSSSHESDM